MTTQKEKKGERFWFIDIARFYGIALVYYGHFIESFMKLNDSSAAMYYKFIYSFHMPLFFILAGFIVKESDIHLKFTKYLKYRVFARLGPYVLFTVILIIPTFWITDNTVGLDLSYAGGYTMGITSTFLGGFPLFNIPTWFLICLFMVEIIHYGAFRFLKSDNMILLGAITFYGIGYWFNLTYDIFNPLKGRMFSFYMIQEAFIVYSFYLFGIFLRRKRFLVDSIVPIKLISAVIVSTLLVFLTFDLNKDLFSFNKIDAVVLLFSSHGHVLLFPLTAIIGSMLILFLAKLTTDVKWLVYLGQNVLIIFCLNGVFYHLINDQLAAWLLVKFTAGPEVIFFCGLIVTIISLALTIPFIPLFNRWIPQFVGKPKSYGPLIKNLV